MRGDADDIRGFTTETQRHGVLDLSEKDLQSNTSTTGMSDNYRSLAGLGMTIRVGLAASLGL